MENSTRKKFNLDSIFRFLLTVSLLLIIVLLIKRLSSVLLPFFIAMLIAYLIYPLMEFFQIKLKLKSRALSIFATLITILTAIAILSYLFIPPIIEQTQKSYTIIVDYLEKSNLKIDALNLLNADIIKQIKIEEHINFENIQNISQQLFPSIKNIFVGAENVISNIFVIFVIILYLIFILLDYEKISTNWIKLVPTKYRTLVKEIEKDVVNGMNRYFRGQALIALIVGILFAIGFSIINLPLAIIFGFFVGFLNLIPYMQLLSLPPALILVLVKSTEYDQSLFWGIMSVLIVYCIVQIIQDTILTPKIMGNVTGLNPAIILLSLSIWGSLLGIIGMIIALPFTTLLLSYYDKYVITKDFEKIN